MVRADEPNPTDNPEPRRVFHRTPFRDRGAESDARRIGLILFLSSLGTVFAAIIVAVVSVRLLGAAPERWRPPGSAALPWELVISTALLLVGSVTIEVARRAARDGAHDRLVRWLRVTTVLGGAFVLSQAWCWIRLLDTGMAPTHSLYGWVFTVLTVLHVIHVVVGMAILGLVTLRAEARRYTIREHAGVRDAAVYWHFLDAVWIVLVITLWAIG